MFSLKTILLRFTMLLQVHFFVSGKQHETIGSSGSQDYRKQDEGI